MRLQILGCSGGIGSGGRTTAMLLDDDILLDAGTGVCDLDVDVLQHVRHIFVTHSHLDHVLSIPLLMDSLFDRLDAPLTVHALPATIEALSSHLFNWTIWPDFRELPKPGDGLLRFAPMEYGDVCTLGARTVRMVPAEHAVPAAGFLVTDASGSCFCYAGDSGPNNALWPVLNRQPRLDLLIVEAAFSDEHAELAGKAGHYVPATLVRDLVQLELDPQVAITHLKTGSDEQIMSELRQHDPDRSFHRLQAGDVFAL